jgi:ABC-type antimicrobial peptide transport system permease subunit
VLFAAAALALAAVGVYGVIAFAVTERAREFGVRLALGARGGQVMALVLREGAALTAVGLGLGLVGAVLAGWWLRQQLFGVQPWDPLTFAATVPVLALAALAACVLPARRALRTDPIVTLRAD